VDGETSVPPAWELLLRGAPGLASHLRGALRAARTDVPILIVGEAGSGRSSVARALHAASRRSRGPLVEVDPGVVPSTLFESEFFGYRRGAFTGADGAGEGRVARAQGGTLLLDHVEELPVAAQPKLLRLLAERRFAPLGGAEMDADVRFVAIGAEDLPARVERATFRADLFYRLAVVAFEIPPLRRRRDDLPVLLDTVFSDLLLRLGRADLALAARARAWMLEHPWPGNLRQLVNTLERGIILATHKEVDPPRPEPADDGPRTLAEVERAEIVKALAHTRGHQERAAALLGISRKSLWEKRRRYGLQ
jgi:DNA-binding NtrC family response regulator